MFNRLFVDHSRSMDESCAGHFMVELCRATGQAVMQMSTVDWVI